MGLHLLRQTRATLPRRQRLTQLLRRHISFPRLRARKYIPQRVRRPCAQQCQRRAQRQETWPNSGRRTHKWKVRAPCSRPPEQACIRYCVSGQRHGCGLKEKTALPPRTTTLTRDEFRATCAPAPSNSSTDTTHVPIGAGFGPSTPATSGSWPAAGAQVRCNGSPPPSGAMEMHTVEPTDSGSVLTVSSLLASSIAPESGNVGR